MERELSLLMEDDEDEIKMSNINIDNNENSYLSSFSNLMKNNLSSIISENNNKNNQILENEDKAYYNISNISNNFQAPPQNFNSPIFENNIPNNLNNNFLHLSKYSFGSINDKAYDYDRNYSKNNNINIINNNNNINKNIYFNNINNRNYFGGYPKNRFSYNIKNNQSYDFNSNTYKLYNLNNMNYSNNITFNNNNFNKTFIDNHNNFNFNNYNKKIYNYNNPQQKKTFKNKKNNFYPNQIINNENNSISKKNMKYQNSINNVSGFSKISNGNNKDNSKISNNNNEKIISMIKDQNKNKYIQKRIEEKSSKFLHKLYKQMKYNLYEIINDQYGNYVIQKYVDYCDKQILSAILKQLYKYNEKAIYEISINKYGTRALQKLFEKISNCIKEEDVEIIQASIKGNITSMIKNINGNHVIQTILENFKHKDFMTFLYKEINQNLIEILKSKPGFCVFLKMIKNFSSDDVNNIFENILNNLDKLINDEYGNFIIQKLISLNNKNYNNKIYNYIKDKIVHLSSQKFASKVIECCMADSIIKNKIIKKIIEENIIKELIIDKFGNYIVQKALCYFKDNEEIFLTIINIIKKNYDFLQKDEFGQKIYEKLKKNYGQYLEK